MLHQLIHQYRPEVSKEQVGALIRQRLSLVALLTSLGLEDQAPAISAALGDLHVHYPIVDQPEFCKEYRRCPS